MRISLQYINTLTCGGDEVDRTWVSSWGCSRRAEGSHKQEHKGHKSSHSRAKVQVVQDSLIPDEPVHKQNAGSHWEKDESPATEQGNVDWEEKPCDPGKGCEVSVIDQTVLVSSKAFTPISRWDGPVPNVDSGGIDKNFHPSVHGPNCSCININGEGSILITHHEGPNWQVYRKEWGKNNSPELELPKNTEKYQWQVSGIRTSIGNTLVYDGQELEIFDQWMFHKLFGTKHL